MTVADKSNVSEPDSSEDPKVTELSNKEAETINEGELRTTGVSTVLSMTV